MNFFEFFNESLDRDIFSQEVIDQYDLIYKVGDQRILDGHLVLDTEIPYLVFRGVHVKGDFVLMGYHKHDLTSSPSIVDGDCHIESCEIQSLRGIASKVGSFTVMHCSNVKDLVGGPTDVTRDYNCTFNDLRSLKGAPNSVVGDFECNNNEHLRTLKGAPSAVGGHFVCSSCHLQTLKGAPKKVGGDFYCIDNPFVDISGAPIEVGGTFAFSGPVTIQQVVNSKIQAKKFIQSTSSVYKDVTHLIRDGRYNITLTSELSGVEDAINITDIDF